MRLIDADRLLKPSFTDMFDKPVKMDMFSRYAIESQPTVEAIPVKWIENYIKRYYGTGDLVYPEEFLKELVTWWGEENETN